MDIDFRPLVVAAVIAGVLIGVGVGAIVWLVAR